MLSQRFHDLIDNKYFKPVIKNGVICILAIGLIVHSVITYSVYRSKRTIIVPAPLKASLSISDIDVSPETLRIMVYAALDLLFSYYPDSAEDRFDTFMRAYAFQGRLKEINDIIKDRLRDIVKEKRSQSFEPESFVILNKGMILVAGRIIPAMTGQALKPEPIFLTVEYRIDEGSVKILNFEQLNRMQYDNLAQRGGQGGTTVARDSKPAERKSAAQTTDNGEEFNPSDYQEFSLGDDDTHHPESAPASH